MQATQPQSWDKLVTLHGSTDKAQQWLAKRVADELTGRGTIDVERAIVERHQANGELIESYFASDERREPIDEFFIRSLYGVIRGEAG